MSEDGTVSREICHDSGGVTIPYIDSPIPDRPSMQVEPSSITQFKTTDFTLQCCCAPGEPGPVEWVEPEYPPEPKRAGIKGWVTVSGSLDPDGHIRDARVDDSSPKGVFDQAAVTAFSRWMYKGEIEPDMRGIARICFPNPYRTVSARDTSVVAFANPALDPAWGQAHGPGREYVEALGHLGSALDTTAACLGIDVHRVQLLEAVSVTVRFGGRDLTFSASSTSGVGAVLLSTDKPPLEIASPAGASALQVLLPQAAATYFDRKPCTSD